MKIRLLVLYLFILMGLTLHGQVIEEGFESGDFSSYEWELTGDEEWEVTSSYPYSGDYCARGGNIDDNQVTGIGIEIDCDQRGILAFAWKVSSEANYDFLRFYLDGDQMAEISGTVAWTQVGYELSAGIHSLEWVFEKDYSVSGGSDTGWIDEIHYIVEEEDYNYDLEVVSFCGASYLLGDESYVYEVLVRNNGNFSFTGYRVSLVDTGGEEYASETVYWALAPGGERLVELEMAVEGGVADTLVSVRAYGELGTDENPVNNYSEKIDMHFAGADCAFAQVGVDSSLTNLLPLNFQRRASVYESLYFADELSGTGAITSIDIFNSFAGSIEDVVVNIWLGETEAMSLESGWIGSDSLELVYSGALDFMEGDNTVNIRLDTLYDYGGDNLVLLLEKEYMEGAYSWQSNFYYSEIAGEETGRTRFNYNDLESFDPGMLTSGVLCDWVANTVFTISPLPYGHVTGTVVGIDLNPISEARVMIDSMNWVAETDSSGYFSIGYVGIGSHELLVECAGYEPYYETIMVNSGDTLQVGVMLLEASGIEENELAKSPLIESIYPNPYIVGQQRSPVQIKFNLSGEELPAELSIYDIRGRKVSSEKINKSGRTSWDGVVDRGVLSSGVYIFRLRTGDGKEASARLLMIK